MTPEQFAEGLVRIGLALRQAPDAATMGVYFDSLRHQVEPEEWDSFTRWAVDHDRFETYFPKLAEIRDALREFRGASPLVAEAVHAYYRVIDSGDYAPQGGTTWNYRTIRERCGDAAAEAFMAAGGNAAFATTWNEDRRRERFVEAYCDAVREDASTALLPAGPNLPALPAPASPSRREAGEILRAIAERAEGIA